ncbi:hypothetical protein DW690_23555 [Dorea longicatena]|nr:hypothetical protein DW690_23555 [Dorea longicatena]
MTIHKKSSLKYKHQKYFYSISENTFSYKVKLENAKDCTTLFKRTAGYGMIGVVLPVQDTGSIK